ncbi:MAG: UDP-N-acetylglucosamine 2-epimerase (non-hydrolyzing), partial [Chloroflexi bacterium]|nr:UDP-N-acetylglucosamine 2-epimerase (non-hydrolyzing) [Chloroflexota bacterium]
MKRVLFILGTRPEAIKLAPIVHEIDRRSSLEGMVCVTGQHRQMLDQVLNVFEIEPRWDLDLMREGQDLPALTARLIQSLAPVLDEARPDIVLVQGDTTTALTGALSAYYARVPVGHVEAGLRTGDKYSPFPEELNRKLIGTLADIHFAPTEGARDNLLAEGVPADRIQMTGNTVVDALLWAKNRLETASPGDTFVESQLAAIPQAIRDGGDGPLLLVTGHRRESFGPDFEAICTALLQIVERNKNVRLAYPVHLNPNVREPVYRILGGAERVYLFEPPPYLGFVWLLSNSHVILTDSGGVQEEAPSLDKPVLVMRRVTERPEGVDAGCARLVGVDTDVIVSATETLLNDRNEYERMSSARNPY